MIRKYDEFVNESKKEDCIEALKKMLKSKPKVSLGKPTDKRFNDFSENYPDVKGIYSLASMKRYLTGKGFTKNNVDKALVDLQKDKEYDLKSINVKNYLYKNQNVPHYYIDLTKQEATEIKKDLEGKSKEMNKKKEVSPKRVTKTTKKVSPKKK